MRRSRIRNVQEIPFKRFPDSLICTKTLTHRAVQKQCISISTKIWHKNAPCKDGVKYYLRTTFNTHIKTLNRVKSLVSVMAVSFLQRNSRRPSVINQNPDISLACILIPHAYFHLNKWIYLAPRIQHNRNPEMPNSLHDV